MKGRKERGIRKEGALKKKEAIKGEGNRGAKQEEQLK